MEGGSRTANIATPLDKYSIFRNIRLQVPAPKPA